MSFEDQGQGAFVRGYQRPPVLGEKDNVKNLLLHQRKNLASERCDTASAKVGESQVAVMTGLPCRSEARSHSSHKSVGGRRQLSYKPPQVLMPHRATSISPTSIVGDGVLAPHEERARTLLRASCVWSTGMTRGGELRTWSIIREC